MKSFLAALQFLTVVPVRIGGEMGTEDIGASMLYFPVVGAVIGCVLAVVGIALLRVLPQPVVGTIVLIILIVLTGGLHLDGFADMCDAFYAGNNKTEVLSIMKDSHVGAIGVIGLIGLLLLKFALLTSTSSGLMPSTLIVMPTVSRWAMVLGAYRSQYVREGGVGKAFAEHVGRKEWLFATIFTVLLCVGLMGLVGIATFLISALAAYGLTKYIERRIEGMTGDTFGAVNEVIEVVVLLTVSLLHFSRALG